MRPEFDRQFDSLLREHARRGGFAPPGGDAGGVREVASASHLDADELSAFAENALPASARARHTAHLADCGDCRRLVSQIALASGVADEIERREPSPAVGLAAVPSPQPHAWRERLAALFRPGAWRYAMPLAALLVVSAVVLVLTSGRRPAGLGNLAAGGEKARPNQTAELHHPAEPKQPTNSAAAANQNATTGDYAGAESRKAETRESGAPATDNFDKIAPPAPIGSVGGAQDALADSAKRPPAEAAPAAATYASEPMPAPTPTPLPPSPARQTSELSATVAQPAPAKPEDSKAENKEKDRFDERERNASLARKQRGHGPMRNESQQQMNARNRQGEEAQAADAASGSSATKSEVESSRKSDGNSTSGSRAAAPAARAAPRRDKSGAGRGDDDGEARGTGTRNVGGRRFRRQGGAWVDTSYRPAQATVQISRGSEQYRSLVGDEPGIGRIANALGGEVIVVWKGRAYRIKP